MDGYFQPPPAVAQTLSHLSRCTQSMLITFELALQEYRLCTCKPELPGSSLLYPHSYVLVIHNASGSRNLLFQEFFNSGRANPYVLKFLIVVLIPGIILMPWRFDTFTLIPVLTQYEPRELQ